MKLPTKLQILPSCGRSNIIVVLDFKVSYLLGSSLNFLIVNYFLFADKNMMFMPKKLTIKQP